MKIVGHPISFRLPGRVSELRNRLSRARYFRGHGVHSPFVYDIVRSVFMRDDLLPGRRDLYEALLTAGVSRRRAVQLRSSASPRAACRALRRSRWCVRRPKRGIPWR